MGAGPAGLEAARVAALGGWSVRLLERSDVVGGMTSVAARGHGRERFSTFVDWLQAECVRSGVSIELGTEVSAADIADPHAPVIVAEDADVALHQWAEVLQCLRIEGEARRRRRRYAVLERAHGTSLACRRTGRHSYQEPAVCGAGRLPGFVCFVF